MSIIQAQKLKGIIYKINFISRSNYPKFMKRFDVSVKFKGTDKKISLWSKNKDGLLTKAM